MNRITKGRGLIGKFIPQSIVDITGIKADKTLTLDQLHLNLLILSGTATGSFTITFDSAVINYYVVYNNSGHTATLKCSGQTGVTLATGKYGIFFCNGTDIGKVTESA